MHLCLKEITKSYKSIVLNNINIDINNGVLGLVGENGAGKTTLLEIIATLEKPSSGKVLYNGLNTSDSLHTIRKGIGYLPQKFDFFPSLTVEECLDYFCRLKGFKVKKQRLLEIENKLQQVRLTKHRNKKFNMLSGGMKQRLGIAQALIGKPKILLVDEPTVGLDPLERASFRQLLYELGKDRIIILSTHIIEDIAMTSDKILVLNNGNVKYFGSIPKLLKEIEGKVWRYQGYSDKKDILNNHLIINSRITAEGVEIRFISENQPSFCETVPPNLEDAYIYFTKGEEGY